MYSNGTAGREVPGRILGKCCVGVRNNEVRPKDELRCKGSILREASKHDAVADGWVHGCERIALRRAETVTDVDNLLELSGDALNLLVAETFSEVSQGCGFDPQLSFIDGVLEKARHANAESVPGECAVSVLVYCIANVGVVVVVV